MLGRPLGRTPELASRRRAALAQGMRAALPAMMATGPWGFVTGVAMVKVGLTPWEALGMTLLVFAGSAQLAALPLIAAAAPVWVTLLTATVVNLRFVIFSAGLYPYFKRFPLAQRLLLGYVTSDVGFAISLQRWSAQERTDPATPRGSSEQVWFFLGIAAANWLAWQSMSIIGIFVGAQVPGTWGLDYAAILALVALTVPMINSRPALVGAATSGVVAVAAAGFPLKLGLVVAVLAGIAAAMAADIAGERVKAKG
jgi:predicted branched-subunit amino acid permease